ncbi:LysE family transporter [Solwaraspora sp. WMMD937]|uniref:LysE/ArgO family amino acid transporter n=1 Tax=Solwaraspora sp. WMMD937 TaxID=3016090 RepID=UPI00249CC2C8|nr:LysE family transporter [Solwaraspora sp. WMMD937]WFE21948.1 LysE family transporter [Solwaraspora sp. WMMD937]
MTDYLAGLLLGLGLIMPIGPQNVFVVSQGLAAGLPRALWAVLAAGCCDTLLIVAGVAGVSGLIATVPGVRPALLVFGVVFLTYLGVRSIRTAGGHLTVGPPGGPGPEPAAGSVRQVVGRTVSVSLLNPHAILDMVGVIGAAVIAQPADSRATFAAGTLSASWTWFLVLAVGAAQARRFLTPRVIAWFDRVSGAIMLVFAGHFAFELTHLAAG